MTVNASVCMKKVETLSGLGNHTNYIKTKMFVFLKSISLL